MIVSSLSRWGLITGTILFSCLIFFANPSLAQTEGSAGAQPTAKISTSDQTQVDIAIRDRTRALFRELEEFNNVFVTVQSGVVTLKGRVLNSDEVERAAELVSRIDGVASIKNLIQIETSVEKRIVPALERFQQRTEQIIGTLPLLGVGLVVFIVVSAVGFGIARLKNPWNAITPNKFVADLLRQLIRLAFLVIGLVLALDILGATALLGTIVGAAGILGLAIGFAVRDTVENYISSIMLSFRQPFRPGDYVDVQGQDGYVMALTSRATILMTVDGNHVRIPNATVFKSIITNYSLNPERRLDFQIGVETEDLQRAVDLGLEVIGELSFILKDPHPDGWIEEIGDSSMMLWFVAWIDQNETGLKKARSEAIRKVKLAFEQEGIVLPEPIYRLRFDDAVPTKASSRTVAKAKPRKALVEQDATEPDVSPDEEIRKKIAEHKAANDRNDLLDPNAPQEIS